MMDVAQMPIGAAFERLGAVLILTIACGWLFARVRKRRFSGQIGVFVGLGLSFIPVSGKLTAADVLFSAIGPLSAAAFVILALLLAPLVQPKRPREPLPVVFFVTIAGLGLLLYPASLGLVRLDPYQWGYGGPVLPVLLALALLPGLKSGAWHYPAAVIMAAAGFILGVYPSRNFWDYLIDPLAWGIALAMTGLAVWRFWRAQRSQ